MAEQKKRGRKQRQKIEVIPTIDHMEMFKIANPQPGRVYACAEDDPVRIQELLLKGYNVLQGDDPEFSNSPIALKKTPDSKPPCPPRHIWMWTTTENKKKLDGIRDMKAKTQEQGIKALEEEFKRMSQKYGSGGRMTIKSEEPDELDF